VILHALSWALLGASGAWALFYSLRWNDSDENWLHRHGECTHSRKSCDDPEREVR
jgi:hypothetical protein